MGTLIPPDHSPTMQRLFPLLNLPDLPFRNIYGHLNFVDLIHLASISKRLKAIIATMERRLKEPTELHFCINFRRRFIGINLEKSSEKNIRSRYFIIEYDTVMPGEWCIERSIYGRTWRIDDSVRGGWTIEKSPEAVLSWLKYFKELFNCRLVLLLTLSQNDSYFEPLFVESDLLHVADKIINNYHGVMSTPRMAFILDTFHANYLEITAKVERDFTYDKPLTRLGMLSLCYAPWLSMEKVWKMIEGGICRQMSFPFNQNWKEEDINEFLKNWLDSDNTTFETLNLKADDSMRRISIDVILNGITTTPGCKKRQDAAEYYDKKGEYERGWDIRRKDGLLATFTVRERSMTFTVWYCLDPNYNDNN